MTQDDIFLSVLSSPAASGLVRTFIAQRMEKWGLQDICDDVLLVASEILTNASEAAPGQELKFRLGRDAGGILVQVWDPSHRLPVSRPVSPLTPAAIDQAPADAWDHGGGWGLPIVQALSADCGYRATPPRGKWVWARLKPGR